VSFSVDSAPWRHLLAQYWLMLSVAAGPEMYVPYQQVPCPWMSLVARTTVAPASTARAITAEISKLDGGIPAPVFGTVEVKVADSVAPQRFNMVLLCCFAGLALGLAALGIYGVMAFSVAQRQHEIGIRMALGAAQSSIFRLIVAQAMTIVVAGVVIGLGGASLTTRLLNTLLYGIGATDPLTFVSIVLLVSVVAFLAAWLPARRAARVDPMIALRAE
jgi:putative ABC transport system permease protein